MELPPDHHRVGALSFNRSAVGTRKCWRTESWDKVHCPVQAQRRGQRGEALLTQIPHGADCSWPWPFLLSSPLDTHSQLWEREGYFWPVIKTVPPGVACLFCLGISGLRLGSFSVPSCCFSSARGSLMGRCYLAWGFRVYLFLEVQGSCLQLMSDPTFFFSFL